MFDAIFSRFQTIRTSAATARMKNSRGSASVLKNPLMTPISAILVIKNLEFGIGIRTKFTVRIPTS